MLKVLSKIAKRPRIKNNLGLPKHVIKLVEIQYDWLYRSGIKGIVLDLDNTIISEDDRYLSPGSLQWIEQAKFQGFKIFILSNGPRCQRAKLWAERLKLPLINPAKKPLPPSFEKACQRMGLETIQVLVIGDSLHTDIMGAWLVGCPFIQVASLPHPPRWWEKIIGGLVQIPYPPQETLWSYDQSIFK